MEGYLLLDEHGNKLTKLLVWSNRDNAGWLWAYEEVGKIIEIAVDWDVRPVYYQRCVLVEDRDDVNVYALSEPEAL